MVLEQFTWIPYISSANKIVCHVLQAPFRLQQVVYPAPPVLLGLGAQPLVLHHRAAAANHAQIAQIVPLVNIDHFAPILCTTMKNAVVPAQTNFPVQMPFTQLHLSTIQPMAVTLVVLLGTSRTKI